MLFVGLPQKKFNTVVIDCPWPISMMGKMKVARNKRPDKLGYATLSLSEIASFPLGQLCNLGAHVYAWTTNRFLPDTFGILSEWGVRYHLTMPLVKKSGMVPGRGYVFGSEFCLLGFYGRPMLPFTGIGKLNWLLTAPVRGGHSKKPDAFYSLVEVMSPGPYLDCFARRGRDNWTSWGDEV